ncbi:MAG TPA: dTDP-4-dehydrorhamnose 3,5-epimerase family protein [Mucilaginibacter sp.]|jgi:dTDP-4-dehydrorhamnose 3,5-epimerase
MRDKPKVIEGAIHNDYRGSVFFVNDFNFNEVKRFYMIQPATINSIRAWQGHKKEQKWFYVVDGSFKVVVVKIDDWENPDANTDIYEFELDASKAQVLYIPAGYANGFKILQPDSKVIIFSDFTLEQSKEDDYRFDQNKWFNWEIDEKSISR